MKANLENILSSPHQRFFSVGKIDQENRTVELSFSSDIRLERWPGFIEVLSHAPESVDLSRLNDGAPLLFNHDMDEVIGVVENANIEDGRKGRALVRFASDDCSEKVWQNVKDGILRNVSVGYKITEIKLTEESDKGEVYTATRWQPYEISIVAVPADPTVGIGRNLNFKNQKDKTMEPKPLEVNEPAIRAEGVKNERERTKKILEVGRQYNQIELAAEYVGAERSFEEFQSALVGKMEERTKVLQNSGRADIGQKEVNQFSLVRLLKALAAPNGERAARCEDAKFEFEVCEAASKNMHRAAKGTVIPFEVLHGVRADAAISIKSGGGYNGTGGSLVNTTLLSQSFIEMLRNRSIIMKYASPLGGLVGNFSIPRQTSKTTAYYVGEDVAPTRDDISFGLLSMSPKTIACTSDLTRTIMNQSSVDVEAFCKAQLALGLSEGIDYNAFYAAGTTNVPRGIKQTSGINSKVFASPSSPTQLELIEMETKIGSSNADVPSMIYVANAKFRGYAKSTTILGNTAAKTIWGDDKTVNGYATEITNQIADNEVFFGNFADLIVGMWGGLDIMVDPYSNSKKGMLSVTMFQDHDFLVRRPESFCFGGAVIS